MRGKCGSRRRRSSRRRTKRSGRPTEAVAGVAWLVREAVKYVENDKAPEFEPPTIELIGRLFLYAHDAQSRLDEMGGYVNDVRENLTMVDELRSLFVAKGSDGG
jgi:hypothetical protein